MLTSVVGFTLYVKRNYLAPSLPLQSLLLFFVRPAGGVGEKLDVPRPDTLRTPPRAE